MTPPGVGCQLIAFSGPATAEKSDVMEAMRDHFRRRVTLVYNAAELLAPAHLGQHLSVTAHHAVLRTLFHLQLDLERTALEDGRYRIALCDGGSLDTLEYWPEPEETFWPIVGATHGDQLRRYAAVIHLRSLPGDVHPTHPLARTVSPFQRRVEVIWRDHPHSYVVEGAMPFLELVERCSMIVEEQLRRFPSWPGLRPLSQGAVEAS